MRRLFDLAGMAEYRHSPRHKNGAVSGWRLGIMWRWVTRGLAFGSLVLLLIPALQAQGFIGSLDSPDPAQTQTGEIFVRGFVLDPALVQHVDLFVDGTFLFSALTDQPRIDIVEAFPNYPGIQAVKPGFATGFLASRFNNGSHTLFVRVFLSD